MAPNYLKLIMINHYNMFPCEDAISYFYFKAAPHQSVSSTINQIVCKIDPLNPLYYSQFIGLPEPINAFKLL